MKLTSLSVMQITWDNHRFQVFQQLARENPERSDFQNTSSVENLDQNGWMASNTMNSKLWNELSLSLATSEPVMVGGINFMDQYSQLTFSDATQPYLNNTELSSNLNSCNSRDVSIRYECCSPVHLSQTIVGSRYLSVIQDILSQITSYSLESSDQVSHSTTTFGFVPFSSSSLDDVTTEFDSDVISRYHSQMELQLHKLPGEAKRNNLLTLLQLVGRIELLVLDFLCIFFVLLLS